jgi:guanine deaminase
MTGPGAAHGADDQHWLGQAIDLAARNVGEGGGPFGALLVMDGELVSTGVNRVTRDLDPSAHAEVSAIRAACRARGVYLLSGAVLYSSCEPCPMCMATALWARLDRVVFGADRDDAAAGGFDDREFYELFAGRDPATWPTTVRNLRPDNATEPFDRWLAKADRVEY